MATVLLFIQHSNGKVLKGTFSALQAARELQIAWGDSGIVGIALGPQSKVAAESMVPFGLSSVRYSEDPLFEKYRAEPYARAIALSAQELGASSVVGLASSTGKDALPRVAALLDAAQASDIIAVNADGSIKRPMYAGNVIADVELVGSKRVVTVRATGFAPAGATDGGGSVAQLSLAGDPQLKEQPRFGEIVSYEISKADRPELSDAEVVVSGGRALGSSDNFEKVMFPLADAFGAAVGASRAAVDSGYAPNDWQVGQTGKVVAPSLYIAVGISGAIQHLAGMKDSKVIVAINKDPDAPIFEVADYGLVADLFTVAPELTEVVKGIRSST
jgi:electron transfer flavoprotein alpha subunit